ncbi:hypothetical protein COT27_03750 [Candidatus Kuenenbacteria bacterium CG08_land_8_20_14_0_20_37_23]|uniref:Uncharacterized protein n=1 Tax=Candidatus Kuenenbacteria bacterium CG08_land_8_20_14_0_20_37_23 TaxID=1974617 RepID=A0A2M6XRT9_9BACT|nr:MAG: hypothetical protein COT27_03750 [Candidatus Kuenenbacteria bacterium CG08_land_8_20_14_0_20_37_23]
MRIWLFFVRLRIKQKNDEILILVIKYFNLITDKKPNKIFMIVEKTFDNSYIQMALNAIAGG